MSTLEELQAQREAAASADAAKAAKTKEETSKKETAKKRQSEVDKISKQIAEFDKGIGYLYRQLADLFPAGTKLENLPANIQKQIKDVSGSIDSIKAKRLELVKKAQNYPEVKVPETPTIDTVEKTPTSAIDEAMNRLETKTQTTNKTSSLPPVSSPSPNVPGVPRTPIPSSKTPAPEFTPVKPGDERPVLGPNVTPKLTIDEIFDKVSKEYGAIDAIFKTDPELEALLTRAYEQKLTADQFTNELQNTKWFKANAGDLQKRGFYKRQYQSLLKDATDPASLEKTTEYGRGLANAKQVLQDEAIRQGAQLSPEDLDLLAQDVYDNALETKTSQVAALIRAKIAYKPGNIISGKAGENLAALKATAAANGLDLDKNFGPSVQGWLQKIAQGESVETYKQIIRNAAKLGLPDKVASLLDNGVDLSTIYQPYKNMMASVLEVNPNTIKLDDPTLRSAIGPDKEMSLYDFQKTLRKDNRWQYTQNAHEEVSNITKNVLKDFGFVG